MEYWFVSVLSIMISVLVTYYLFRKLNFFKRHGIIHIASITILGATASIIFRRMSFVDFIRKVYNLNRDAKQVKNFDIMINNPVFVDANVYVFSQNLFFFFTKYKVMARSTLLTDKNDINMKDIFDRYTNDVIVLSIYGMKIDSIRDPTNKFYICGKNITYMLAIRNINYIFIRTFPKLGRILNIKLLNNHEIKYFENRIKNEIAIRDAEHVTRSDMIQLTLDNRDKEHQVQLDVDDIVAQTYAFFRHTIVVNPIIQVKLRQEIDKFLNESDRNLLLFTFCYGKSMWKCLLPPALPGEKSFTINKSMIICIPLYAIYHDEKNYDNSEEFRPEKFFNNVQDNNYQFLFYFPFGLRSRMCIDRRFGLLMIKIVCANLSTLYWVENNRSVESCHEDLVNDVYSSLNFEDVLLTTGKIIFTQTLLKERLDQYFPIGMEYLPKDDQCGVVYKINCLNWESSYVGQTKRKLKTRIKKHKADTKKSFSENSVVSRHHLNEMHELDWDNIRILDTEQSLMKRRISEMIHIKK
ncbi:CP9E2 protein, partial [Pseudoatta argentina]